MSDTPRTDEQHARFPMGGFTLDFARQLERELAEERRHINALAKSLIRLHNAADAFAADQSDARDVRRGLVQPVTVAECEDLNQALKAAWELLNQPTGTAERALATVKGGEA